jgi:hypothetical protein
LFPAVARTFHIRADGSGVVYMSTMLPVNYIADELVYNFLT